MVYKNSAQRFREIVKIMAYYGFGFLVDSKLKKQNKSPINLRKAFVELGPTFIKIGQILSTRPDLLPIEYIEELAKLQDDVPAEDFDDINNIFLHDFNHKIDELFCEFDKIPLASASIAQVHRAVLNDGKEVIVKVQRPYIYQKMQMDITILKKLASLATSRFSDWLIVDPKEALDEILISTELELDFENEANNILKFHKLNHKVSVVHTPFIIRDMCSKNVITMEKIDGKKITDTIALRKAGYNTDTLGKNLALSFFKQVFEDGFFHGDPHPGNILVRNNKLCFIDFGIMGSLSTSLKNALNELIVAIAFEDINNIISVIMSITIKNGYVDRNQLYEDLDYLLATYLSTSLKNIKVSAILDEMMEVARRNNLKMPKELTLLAKSMVIVEGVIAEIAPDIKILDVAIPYVKYGARKRQLKDLNIEELLLKTLNITKESSKLPSKLVELSDSIVRGRAKIQIEYKNIDIPLNSLNRMVNRLVYALLISSMIIGSSLIIHSNIGAKLYGLPILGLLGFAVAAVMALWLLISILKSGRL